MDKVKVDERRRDQRRTLHLGRIAILEVDGKSHVVSLIDISRGGAYLGTRLVVEHSQQMSLALTLPGALQQLRLACRLVRRITAEAAEKEQRLQGLAVQFQDVNAEVAGRIDEFVVKGSTS